MHSCRHSSEATGDAAASADVAILGTAGAYGIRSVATRMTTRESRLMFRAQLPEHHTVDEWRQQVGPDQRRATFTVRHDDETGLTLGRERRLGMPAVRITAVRHDGALV